MSANDIAGKTEDVPEENIVTISGGDAVDNFPSVEGDDLDVSLKHRLAGPSVTKAGQDTVDQSKVSNIIYNVSKGSKFFSNEETRDKALTEKINRILARKKQLEKFDQSHEIRKADNYIESLELSRDLSQTMVHIDCDAFYAAVEELDRPDLKDVPFSVGKGVLTTCNYHARKYGCRSGMAGFVAKALCPQLVFLPLDFTKYTAKATEVRAVLEKYDPRFESASIDEAYLNITEYSATHQMDPEDVVRQIREEVHTICKITVSAGIAANAKLAKIGSNRNKPNGQFRVAPDRTSIMSFMRNLPVRKVNGVGRVFERELDAIGVKTCGDIYEQRGLLSKLFGEKAFMFLIQCYLGLGRTSVAPMEEHERKSVGTERTFREIQGASAFRDKLQEVADELDKDLKRTEFKGRTLVLKIKLHTFEVLSRQTVPPFAVSKSEDLFKFALPMLARLEKEIPHMRLRLMGLRCTNLVSTAKSGSTFFGTTSRQASTDSAPKMDEDGWEVWPEEAFEAAARREREDEMETLEKLSQEHDASAHINPLIESPKHSKVYNTAPPKPQSQERFWDCPVCSKPQPTDDRLLNAHIDFCLSRQAIRDVVSEEGIRSSDVESRSSSVGSKKRTRIDHDGGEGRDKTDDADTHTKRKRPFFSV